MNAVKTVSAGTTIFVLDKLMVKAMHIDVELDPLHAERLAQLQRTLQKPLSEVLATVIDLALSQSPQPRARTRLPEAMSVGSWPKLDLRREALYGDGQR